MSVATWLSSNFTTQPASTYKAAIDGDFAVAQRAVDNFAPHAAATPNMTVLLDAGHVYRDGQLSEIAAQTTPVFVAPSGNPRIDRIIVDRATGALAVLTGTPAATPAPPPIPPGKNPVAQVALQPSTTAITNAMLTDERDLSSLGLGTIAGYDRGLGPGQVPTAELLGGAAFADVIDTSAASYGAADGGKAVVLNANGAVPAAALTGVISGVPGAFKRLKLSNGATNQQGTTTADALTLADGNGNFFAAVNVNVTADVTVIGANGLDISGAIASAWLHKWVIYNPSTATLAGLFSLSSTAPTMPAGYSFKARVGAMFCDGSTHFLRTLQFGRRAQYVVTASSNTTNLPIMASGAAGAPATPTWVAVATGNFVPPTAARILGVLGQNGTATASAAPNNNYGAIGSNTNPPPASVGASGFTGSTPFEFALETGNIYWASSSASGVLAAFGWEDNL